MKRWILGLAALTVVCVATTTASAALIDGLMSHLPLDGNADAGAAGSGGVIIGTVNFSAGKFGEAAGVTAYGDGHIPLLDDLGAAFGTSTDFSMSLWMKFDSYSSDPAFFSNKSWNSGGNTGINVAFNGSNRVDFNTKAAGGSRLDIHTANNALTPGAWQNFLFTVDRDGPTKLYIDGTEITNQTIPLSSQGSLDGAYNWTLLNDGTGSYGYGSTTAGLQMDEFAAWDRILDAGEIAALQTAPIPYTPAAPKEVLLFEDFESLTLGPFVSPTEGGGDGTDWTDVPPAGWGRDNGTTPVGSPAEFLGWTFLDKNSWIATEGNQNRSQFTFGQGTVMVADGDAYDDGTNVDPDLFNTLITTPGIDLSTVEPNTVVIEFDSSWRDYDTQTATLDVSFDGGATFTNVFTEESDVAGDQELGVNEHLLFDIDNPGTGTMVFQFGYLDAGNDWWWSVDNVKVSGVVSQAVPEPSTCVLLVLAAVGLVPWIRRRKR